jgi:hypothetical protein
MGSRNSPCWTGRKCGKLAVNAAWPTDSRSKQQNVLQITDECRCAAYGGLPCGTCLRSLAGPLRAPARSLRHVGTHFTLSESVLPVRYRL